MEEFLLNLSHREVFAAVNDGLMVVGSNGIIKMVNSAMERMTGHSRNEMVGASCAMLNCDACERVMSETQGTWCLLFEKGRVNEKRCLLMRKDGSFAAAIKNAFVFKHERSGHVLAFETFTDISELEKKNLIISELKRGLAGFNRLGGALTRSTAMRPVIQAIERATQNDEAVIIYGEPGTGKDAVAHAIHEGGRRKHGPFLRINCAGMSEPVLDSELFGSRKGASPWARGHRKGLIESADGGDLLIESIQDMPLPIQDKVLDLLRTRHFKRRGEDRLVPADVRIIGATESNLGEFVFRGTFREELFHRMSIVSVQVPPLRERKEDVPLLASAFVKKLSAGLGKNIWGISSEVLELFTNYDWPGNLNELKSLLQHAMVVADTDFIELRHLPHYSPVSTSTAKRPAKPLPEDSEMSKDREALLEALRASDGNKSKAAEILGVHRMTVWNRMKRYGIQVKKKVER